MNATRKSSLGVLVVLGWLAGTASGALSDAVAVSVSVGGDIDAYTDSDDDGISDLWEFNHFYNLGTVNRYSDFDGDSFPDLSECLAGTDPRDPQSFLQIASIGVGPDGVIRVIWDSTTNAVPAPRSYDIYAAPSVNALASGGTRVELDVPSSGDSTHADLSMGSATMRFYRVHLHREP